MTTTLTSLPFATMTLTTVLPAMCAATDGSASAASRISSSLLSAGTVTRPRTLPLTCTGITTSSAFATAGSNGGHGANTMPPGCPVCSHSSSAM